MLISPCHALAQFCLYKKERVFFFTLDFFFSGFFVFFFCVMWMLLYVPVHPLHRVRSRSGVFVFFFF